MPQDVPKGPAESPETRTSPTQGDQDPSTEGELTGQQLNGVTGGVDMFAVLAAQAAQKLLKQQADARAADIESFFGIIPKVK
ncbi:MAG: hypothetical protein ABL963_11675 [Longimicrobiales bacterium]